MTIRLGIFAKVHFYLSPSPQSDNQEATEQILNGDLQQMLTLNKKLLAHKRNVSDREKSLNHAGIDSKICPHAGNQKKTMVDLIEWGIFLVHNCCG
ncbi:MAG: hypothetical protein NTW90_08735 [Nitrosospira sp.]|nr:hypothetical protein [Nitrosospira sp.]